MSKDNTRKSNNFIIQGGILAIAGIVVRIIGMIYRIPLTHIIGDRGNSLYDSAYSAYSIILIISAYSMPVAISKVIATYNSKHDYKNSERIFRGAMIYAATVGFLAALLCFVFAPYLVKAEGAVPVLRVLAPVIFFSAILGTFRGLFQGQGTMVPTSVSQIFEQIFNAIVSVLAAYLLVRPFIENDPLDKLPSRGAMGSTLGTGAGVLAGLAFILFVYFLYRPTLKTKVKKSVNSPVLTYPEIFKMIFLTVTPMLMSAALYNVSPFIDNYMIYAIMDKKGYIQSAIQTMHGIYTGKYLLMVNIPVAIASALSSAMLPSISAARARNDHDGVLRKASLTVKVTMMIALPCTCGLAALGGPAILLIFKDSKFYPNMAGQLLFLGSSFVLFFALSTVTNTLLQATDHLRIPVIHSVIALVIHVLLAFVFLQVFDMGVWGLMLSTIAFALVLCIMNQVYLYNHVGFTLNVKDTILLPGGAALLMGILCFLVYKLLMFLTKINAVSFLVAFLVGVIVYVILLFGIKAITEEELSALPKGGKLVSVAKRLHLLRG